MRAIWVFYSGISLTQRAPKTNQMGSVGVNLLSFGVRLEKLSRNSGSRSTAQPMCVLMGTPHIQVPQLWVLAHPFPGWPQTGHCFSYSLCPISLFSLVSFLILKIKMIKALHDYTLISKKKNQTIRKYMKSKFCIHCYLSRALCCCPLGVAVMAWVHLTRHGCPTQRKAVTP